jgi:hypothetical protein
MKKIITLAEMAKNAGSKRNCRVGVAPIYFKIIALLC